MMPFPITTSKKELKARYNVSDYLLRKWVGEELTQEIDWVNKRCFNPNETRKIFMRLSKREYEEFLRERVF